MSAFYASTFTEAVVVVVDGAGSETDRAGAPSDETLEGPLFECASIYHFTHNDIRKLYSEVTTHHPYEPQREKIGLGRLYSYASKHIFQNRYDAGKVMALAAFGERQNLPSFLLPGPHVAINQQALAMFEPPLAGGRDAMAHADLAARVQFDTTQGLLRYAQLAAEMTGLRNACFAGGVFLNCPANSAIVASGLFGSHYFFPAATDDGVALGASYFGMRERPVIAKELSPFLGRSYTDQDIEAALQAIPDYFTKRRLENESEVVSLAAARLAEGRVIGWFQGGSEFGPRALGNRSILANPAIPGMRDHINRSIKGRETFRPLAPLVRQETVHQYFEVAPWFRSPYMLLTARCRDSLASLAPEVLHEDGSARVQTVTQDDNELIHRLLEAFQQKAGMGVLINTSLNGPEEPIVETPGDAVRLFLSKPLNDLFIGGFVISRPADAGQPLPSTGF